MLEKRLDDYADLKTEIKDSFAGMTDFEAYSLALQLETVNLLRKGLGVDYFSPSYVYDIRQNTQLILEKLEKND